MTTKDNALRMAIELISKCDIHAGNLLDITSTLNACNAALSDETVTLPDCVVDESAPKAIWLNVGDEDSTYADALSSYEEITWCEDKQYDKDVKYIRADLVTLPDGWVVKRQFLEFTAYAYAHPNGFFDWGGLCQAVKFSTKLEAMALIACMGLAVNKSVSVEQIKTQAAPTFEKEKG